MRKSAGLLWTGFSIEIGVYAALVALLARATGSPLWLLIALPLVLAAALRIALVVVSFALASRQAGWRWSARTALSTVCREIVALMRLEALIMSAPLRGEPRMNVSWRGEPRSRHGSSRTDRGIVVLVHGLLCNRGVWRPLQRQLLADGWDVRVADLQPVTAGLRVQLQGLAAWLERLGATAGDRPIIAVAHSLGGLLLRLYLAQSAVPAPLRKLICIATPHAGTTLAHLARLPVIADLRPGSEPLAALAAAGAPPGDTVCFYSHHDNLVAPVASGNLPGARNVAVDAIGHISLLFAPATFEFVRRELAALPDTATD